MHANTDRVSYITRPRFSCATQPTTITLTPSSFSPIFIHDFFFLYKIKLQISNSLGWKMNPQSLLASAAINIGLALLILSLFSVLKKQPSNASVYYARPLSHRRQIPVHFPSSPLRRFLPSLSWVFRAFSVTEAQILDAHGLDSLVIIRLFKFGSVHLPTSSLRFFHIHFLFFRSSLYF